ncbi:MAG: hypothetical protein AAF542_13850 [Pseudomonadota bacterium]
MIAKPLRAQQGVVLLMIALAILVGSTALILSSFSNDGSLAGLARSNKHSLSEARDALLGYALSYPENHTGASNAPPGFLPCPDVDGDGLEDVDQCDDPDENSIGFLPWRTLGLAKPGASSGTTNCLWYAVSAGFKSPADTAGPPILNSSSNGRFQIENVRGDLIVGASAADRAIAIVFDPGQVLTIDGPTPSANDYLQNRLAVSTRTACGAQNTNDQINQAINYLDRLNGITNAHGTKLGAGGSSPGATPLPSDGVSVFVTASQQQANYGPSYNDQLTWIGRATFEAVFDRMNSWTVSKVQNCVARYGELNVVGSKRYPWAASLDSSADPQYEEQNGQRFGRIPSVLNSPGTSSWPPDPDPASSSDCFSWPWWPAWQEGVFYAVHEQHTDPVGAGSTVLELDGAASEFVVLLANEELSGQTREGYTNKGRVQNYLEGQNQPATGSATIPPGDEAFVRGNGSSVNDVACNDNGC